MAWTQRLSRGQSPRAYDVRSSRYQAPFTPLKSAHSARCSTARAAQRRRRRGQELVSDAELVALAVCQAAMGICSDRQFLGLVERVLPGWFPHLPEQS